jgi:hypothetical protein
MWIIIFITIIVLITLFYCPLFDLAVEHYAAASMGKAQPKAPAKVQRKALAKAPPAKGPAKGPGIDKTLTPTTVINMPLGLLTQYLNNVGAGGIES